MPTETSVSPSTAEQLRLLLARWEQSLALHEKYLALDDQRYWHVQPWPKHERPARWIVELARQRVAVLSRSVAARSVEGDRAFLEALEAMAFLANLVGLTTVERFIPLATNETERRDVLGAKDPTAVATPAHAATSRHDAPATPDGSAARDPSNDEHASDATQEMPRVPASRVHRLLMQQRAGVPVAIIGRSNVSAHPRALRRETERPVAPIVPVRRSAMSFERRELLVIEDAARLLGWGRKWHELPDLIARLAERPEVNETRRILRQHREHIAKLRGGSID
ncbi:MAG: hypothetical protein KDI32_05905 [Pseudomonadales bacterium]|nr:hypothetical protein [Pseudomonadales bacterium]